MFTGIIEAFGTIQSVERQGTNSVFWISSPISDELKIDQSVAHNGVCLTVDALKQGMHRVTAIEETLKKTDLSTWDNGILVNLERCMTMNGRIDGHIVQGHVDTTAVCIAIKDANGSHEFQFNFNDEFAGLVIEKGSISLNGISLTIFGVEKNTFKVAIIPYTYTHTNIQQIKEGSTVNIEFDMIGKYVNRMLLLQK